MARAKQTIARRQAAKETATGDRIVASNRRARHDFDLLETFECGIVLQGSEVKSLREGKAQLSEAFARVLDGELWLYGMHIPPWQFAQGIRGSRSGSTAQAAGAPGSDRRATRPDDPNALDLGAGVAVLPRRPCQGRAGPGPADESSTTSAMPLPLTHGARSSESYPGQLTVVSGLGTRPPVPHLERSR